MFLFYYLICYIAPVCNIKTTMPVGVCFPYNTQKKVQVADNDILSCPELQESVLWLGYFEVNAAEMMKIQVLQDVKLCHWCFSIFRRNAMPPSSRVSRS